MARDILSEYGPEHHSPEQSPGHSGVTTDGGKPYCDPTFHYQPPVGPINQHYLRPGLPGGINHGQDQKCTPAGETSGSVSAGTNHGNSGSQGRH